MMSQRHPPHDSPRRDQEWLAEQMLRRFGVGVVCPGQVAIVVVTITKGVQPFVIDFVCVVARSRPA